MLISPFGSSGPYAEWSSTDCTDAAISGHLLLNGDPDREPLQGPPHQSSYAAGLYGAIGALSALRARKAMGRGQDIEVTHHEAMVALHQFTLLRFTHNGDVLRRMGNRYAGPGRPIGLYRCRDGAVSITLARDDQVERMLAVTGSSHLLERPGIETTFDLMHHPTLLDDELGPWLAERSRDEVIDLFQAVLAPCGPVNTITDLLDDAHLADRDFWQTGVVAETTVRTPGPPFRLWGARPADSDAGADRRSSEAPSAGRTRGADVPAGLVDGPLTGVCVLDLTRVWAGPMAARILADLGADVVSVEAPYARGGASIDRTSVLATHYYPDDEGGERHWNRIGFVNKNAINKRSLAIDLATTDGLGAMESLVGWADVLIENYSPRVMPQFGLDERRLHELNADLVYVTMPGLGRSGPRRDWVAYGPMLDGYAGLSALMGYADEDARKGGVAWPDPVAGLHAAVATTAALLQDPGDGERGLTVEVAQLEAAVNMVGHAVIDQQIRDDPLRPIGNRDPDFAPQGVYPCAGEDRWIAISVTCDEAWAALCAELDLMHLVALSGAERREQHDHLDELIAARTITTEQRPLMVRLQTAGVAAAAVLDAAQVMADPHLAARGSFVRIDHPEAGRHAWPRVPIRLGETPASYRRPAPCLGEHNREVLHDLAGLDNELITELAERHIVVDRPPS